MEMRIVHNNLPRWCHDAGVLAGGPWCLVQAAKDRRWFPYVRQWADTGGDTAEQWLVCPASQPVHQRLCPGAETSDHHEEPPHHRPARPRPGPRPAPPRTRPVLQRHPQPLLASDQPLQRRPLRGWRHEVTPGRVLQFLFDTAMNTQYLELESSSCCRQSKVKTTLFNTCIAKILSKRRSCW